MAHRRNYRRHRNLGDGTDHPADPAGSQAEDAAEQAAAAAFRSIPLPDPAEADPSGVREAKMARARALIADPGYPPKQVLDSLASLLAKHLEPGSNESQG